MFTFIFALVVGLLIGWYLPQPEWAKDSINAAVNWVKNLFNGNKS